MQQSLMQQGFDLLIYGMGTVFVFLTVLVFVTMAMSAIMRRFFPDEEIAVVVAEPTSSSASVSPNITAVIKAAVEQHRNKRR